MVYMQFGSNFTRDLWKYTKILTLMPQDIFPYWIRSYLLNSLQWVQKLLLASSYFICALRNMRLKVFFLLWHVSHLNRKSWPFKKMIGNSSIFDLFEDFWFAAINRWRRCQQITLFHYKVNHCYAYVMTRWNIWRRNKPKHIIKSQGTLND